ncbi:hypothetical protein DPMN_009519 [Dreissena polymorpha]|uniref:Uncharacterized protein n=1 Tax=Dreissena polymorpha TaxID=45954 RepID=A0A9D4RYA1_DREPO|nr:hypothetical protein DPMN_009519 [Dreissena polymorpha]
MVVLGIVSVQAFKHTAMAQAASKTVVLGPGGLTFGLQVNLPWALVVSGISGAFPLITAIVIGIRVRCCSPVIGGESTRYTAHYVAMEWCKTPEVIRVSQDIRGDPSHPRHPR